MRMSRSAAIAAALAIVATVAIAYLVLRSPLDEIGQGRPSATARPLSTREPSATSEPVATSEPPATRAPSPSNGEEIVFVGAGDIAVCQTQGDEATAALLDEIVADHPEAVVFTTGDNAYPDGSHRDYVECYGPSWGRHLARTRPAVGNHEFDMGPGEGFHRYFGEAGGPADRLYYSYDLDGWHIVVLNSHCRMAGCTFGAAEGDQLGWLDADLEATDFECTIAIWHHPRWSSGRYGPDARFANMWEVLYHHGAEIVLNGHEHIYERFEPMAPDGARDDNRGIRQFTVGTGGAGLRGFPEIAANSAARGSEHGVLKLTLGDGRYGWEFVPVNGGSLSDAGTGSCH
jgi:acid phosphatase type 7